MNRRDAILAIAASPLLGSPLAAAGGTHSPGGESGRLKQSVMNSVWGGSGLSFEERCRVLAELGFAAVDLPQRRQIPVLREYGLAPAIMTGTGTSFQNGLIRPELHDSIETATRAGIDLCAEVGCPNLIAIPGERRGMSREEGADNAVAILSRVKDYAAEKGVVVCMEITNSKVVEDARTDQIFDRLGWGIDVCRRVDSPSVKIVYDIYHVQISDGDIVRNFRDHFDLICHIHVAGVPTRAEIDDTQELNYRYIARVIADLGYQGYVGHEHRPSPGRDPIESLRIGYEILTV
jgi:hydroxypyruvate isomerase